MFHISLLLLIVSHTLVFLLPLRLRTLLAWTIFTACRCHLPHPVLLRIHLLKTNSWILNVDDLIVLFMLFSGVVVRYLWLSHWCSIILLVY